MIKNDIFRVIKNSSYLIGNQAANYLVPFLVLPFISRNYSHDAFGLVLISLSICQLGYMLTEFGFNISLTDKIRKGLDANEIWQLKINIIKIRFITSVFFIIIVAFIFNGNYSAYCFIVMFSIVFFQAIQPLWYYNAVEEFKKISIILLITKLSQVPLFFLFVFCSNNVVVSFLLSISISQLIGTVYSTYDFYIINSGKLNYQFLNKGFVKLLNDSYGFFFSRIYSVLPYYVGAPIVGRLYSVYDASLFGAGDSLGRAAKGLTGTVVQAFYPRISESKSLKLFLNFYLITTMILCFISGIVSLYSSQILSIIYGPNYESAEIYLDLSLIIVILWYSSNLLGYPLFSLIDKKTVVNKITFFVFLFFALSICFVTIYNYSPLFILYSLIIMEVLSSILKVVIFFVIRR